MNPFQRIAQWLDRKGDEAGAQTYDRARDPYIQEVIEPYRAKLAKREERLERGQSFLTDHMRGPERPRDGGPQ